MKNRVLFILVLGMFLLVLAASLYFFYKLKKEESLITPSYPEGQIREIPHEAGDPIRKTYLTNNKGFIYDFEGAFAGELKPLNPSLLEGEFIIKDDPLNRKIKVFVGSVEGTILFGKYKDSFSGDGLWTKTANNEVAREIKPGEDVKMRVEFSYSDNDSIDEPIRKREEITDKLINEFKSGTFDFKIPADFMLATNRVAVIR